MIAALLAGILCLDATPSTAPVMAGGPRPTPTAPARRPLDEYPAFVRPLLKYGVGGLVAGWFVVGISWVCLRRLRDARDAAAKKRAQRWVAGMLLGVVLSLGIIGLGLLLWLRSQQLLPLFISGPAAVLLPPFFARLLAGSAPQPDPHPDADGGNDAGA